MAESLCWSCGRAYAKPDPDGCGFHRKERESVFEQSELSEKSRGLKTTSYISVTVTRCSLYKMSDRVIKEKLEAYSAKRERANEL